MSRLVDFVERQRRNMFDPPVRSLMDIDFYKFTMGQLIFHRFKSAHVKFSLINRDRNIPVALIVPEKELRKYLDHARSLRYTYTDIAWLRGMRVYGKNMFAEEYMDFLENYSLPPYELTKKGNQYELTFSGTWSEVSMWETIALAIISELYYRHHMRKLSCYELDVLYARAKSKAWTKFEKIAIYPDIRFADFSQRRRNGFPWQDYMIGAVKEKIPNQFTGTSNTWMAFHHDLIPIGTNAHELPMVLVALRNSDEEKRQAQYQVLEYWQELYGDGLRIFLPDTYGSKQFFDSAPEWLAHNWRGMRQDSGDPIESGYAYIRWLKKYGVDPCEKLIVFSDGLDVDSMIRIHKEFKGQIKTAFGWGTLFANDFRDCFPRENRLFRPFSLVCKVVEVNGRPAVKLSDNVQKATGPEKEVARYIEIFGNQGQSNVPVIV